MTDPTKNSSISRRAFVRDAAALGAFSFLAPSLEMPARAQAQSGASASTGEHAAASTELHRLDPVPIEQVVIDDEFWSPKRRVWQSVTIRDCFSKFETDRGGAINNFDKVRAHQTGGHAGDPWMDGLIYEMIRGSSDFIRSQPDPALVAQLDGYIDRIAAAAAIDQRGYINTYTQLMEPGHEWGLNGGLQIWQHEIYNLGALLEAGIHYYRATGKTVLLSTGVRIANYMSEYMGPAPKKNLVPCHPLPEEALVRLYELFCEQPELKSKITLPVKEDNYLALAEFWIENRGNNIGKPNWDRDRHAAEQFVRNQEYGSGRPSWGAYAQDDAPVFAQQDIHGHAVRATLLCTGIAAAARVNDDERYRATAVRLWENMVYRRMHITGGVGAYAEEEKFGADYALPNDAYLETCAAVGAGFFHHNMNMAFGHSRYADELERTLYNGSLSGVSLKGDSYFYMNPLECTTARERWAWHECPCCPPMFLKMMGAMPGYIYATDADSIYVNLYIGSKVTIRRGDATVVLRQTTRYPWDGAVRLTVESPKPVTTNLMLRIPAWCSGERVRVNGKAVATSARERGYLRLAGRWKQGDVIELDLPMPVRRVRTNPLVQADAGRVAVMRGPLVYCVESPDTQAPVRTLSLPAHTEFKAAAKSDIPGVSIALEAAAISTHPSAEGLYFSGDQAPDRRPAAFTAIPYYANANRGKVDMAVWLPIDA